MKTLLIEYNYRNNNCKLKNYKILNKEDIDKILSDIPEINREKFKEVGRAVIHIAELEIITSNFINDILKDNKRYVSQYINMIGNIKMELRNIHIDDIVI